MILNGLASAEILAGPDEPCCGTRTRPSRTEWGICSASSGLIATRRWTTMSLRSARFSGNPVLEAIAQGDQASYLRFGAQSERYAPCRRR